MLVIQGELAEDWFIAYLLNLVTAQKCILLVPVLWCPMSSSTSVVLASWLRDKLEQDSKGDSWWRVTLSLYSHLLNLRPLRHVLLPPSPTRNGVWLGYQRTSVPLIILWYALNWGLAATAMVPDLQSTSWLIDCFPILYNWATESLDSGVRVPIPVAWPQTSCLTSLSLHFIIR